MKKTRLVILGALIAVALVAAVAPALAVTEFGLPLNWSFEFDTDGNGVPNNWKMTGQNAIYVCGHSNPRAYDDCVIGFLSNEDGRAIVWQHPLGSISLSDLNDQEGYPTALMQLWAAAQNLDSDRVYGGWIACWDESDVCLRYYGALPGGSYNFSYRLLWDSTQNAEKPGVFQLLAAPPDRFVWGFMALPGSGQAFIDFASPTWSIVP